MRARGVCDDATVSCNLARCFVCDLGVPVCLAFGERALLCCGDTPPSRGHRTSHFCGICSEWNFSKCLGHIADRLDSDWYWRLAGTGAYQARDPPRRMASAFHAHWNVCCG